MVVMVGRAAGCYSALSEVRASRCVCRWAELARRRASDAAGHGLRSFLTPGVLQSYLDPPLLLARKKVDLRCYVLVASVHLPCPLDLTWRVPTSPTDEPHADVAQHVT
jgi:hypothetical protein